MKELKNIVAFSFILLAFLIDSFADAEWRQNEHFNTDDHEENELLQNGASKLS